MKGSGPKTDSLRALARTLTPRSNVCLTAFMGNRASKEAKDDFKQKCNDKKCQYKKDTNECLKYVYSPNKEENPGKVQAHGQYSSAQYGAVDNAAGAFGTLGAALGTLGGPVGAVVGGLGGAAAGAAASKVQNKMKNKLARSLVEVKQEGEKQAKLDANAQVRATTLGFSP